ncbi:Non-reducing end beta-L-arabinofuranosidase [Botrimarina colliarenosi]|uniref:Non-reducing end beta-L-arabinofuranosidase n=2 Tax=Botrimarina TaxID=2795782 RepID=A0A5C5VVN2_9BACT|nr:MULTISPECIES: beta-L-arabinofuranosidase domain-containing protein [Botrimarina]TWT42648.1 Non-reducing end beta-L-arabinofuranosidase [Botrimarina hoheduenensis]TWT92131.1 Non-reducing end beta-L-arabinofuranosidase [Botrimarina colliarenosi]
MTDLRRALAAVLLLVLPTGDAHAEPRRHSHYLTNRAPLAAKPYTELPLGAIKPQGWLHDQLERLAAGMTGRLDELYPEVVGPRNGWLGGDGDGWERGPYWIDGLLPLAHLLDDRQLLAKAERWVEWTLENQAPDGYLGPVPFDSPPAAEPGLQRDKRRDWWPKMVMLKVLQQHYMATGDERVVEALTRYFRYQLQRLPKTPLGHWTFWGNRRGADNLLVVYWLYNVTGEPFLLELGDLVHGQTHPYTHIFLHRDDIALHGPFDERQWTAKDSAAYPFHCVNLAQGLKAPIVRSQADTSPEHLRAVCKALDDLEKLHGQPHGLFGGDEALHGREPTRGSELCTAVEMMYSLEKMLEITGETEFADRLELVAFNALASQVSDDCLTRQYFQLANQVTVTHGIRNFYNNESDRMVFGLLSGYPCCTCNLHQAWPKFTQHLWMASADDGLAAMVYAPSRVKARVGSKGCEVTITEKTDYPFREVIEFRIEADQEVRFPFHLRIPHWCAEPEISVNGEPQAPGEPGDIAVLDRLWRSGDTVTVRLPMELKMHRWHEDSASLQRGPLVYGLRIDEQWKQHAEYLEVHPASPWNYALLEPSLESLPDHYQVVERTGALPDNPWTLSSAPLEIKTTGVRLPHWKLYNGDTGPIPWSPQQRPAKSEPEPITLVPYGCTTLRISAFPTVF